VNNIDENEKNGKILQFGIQADDMSIKKSIEWDGQQYHGLVDIGMDRINNNDFNDDREATYVFVIMLVALNAHFKTPISFYFNRSLTAEERANIITKNLIILSDNGIKDIRSITFDGAASNISMIQKLGINNKVIHLAFLYQQIKYNKGLTGERCFADLSAYTYIYVLYLSVQSFEFARLNYFRLNANID